MCRWIKQHGGVTYIEEVEVVECRERGCGMVSAKTRNFVQLGLVQFKAGQIHGETAREGGESRYASQNNEY